mmetsp:Transcript_44108/g.105053  ORF Transcript_44108/g.105053 Transcript_44108/m.105053 type:complete len:279 (+) Transcript_44108:611-1447(+)
MVRDGLRDRRRVSFTDVVVLASQVVGSHVLAHGAVRCRAFHPLGEQAVGDLIRAGHSERVVPRPVVRRVARGRRRAALRRGVVRRPRRLPLGGGQRVEVVLLLRVCRLGCHQRRRSTRFHGSHLTRREHRLHKNRDRFGARDPGVHGVHHRAHVLVALRLGNALGRACGRLAAHCPETVRLLDLSGARMSKKIFSVSVERGDAGPRPRKPQVSMRVEVVLRVKRRRAYGRHGVVEARQIALRALVRGSLLSRKPRRGVRVAEAPERQRLPCLGDERIY